MEFEEFDPKELRHLAPHGHIPRIFHPFESEGPFDRCILCEKYLLDEGTIYMIERSIKPGDVIFEYAMCWECDEKMKRQMSEESLKRVQGFFIRNRHLHQRRQRLMAEGREPAIGKWLGECAITGKPATEVEEYHLCAICDGNQLLYTDAPLMISIEAIHELSELLSAKTREELDDFIDDHFGLPPEWKDVLKERDLVLF